jgi:hypothetical protein
MRGSVIRVGRCDIVSMKGALTRWRRRKGRNCMRIGMRPCIRNGNRATNRVLRGGRHNCLPGVLDRFGPFLHFGFSFGLEIEHARCGNEPKGVFMLLEVDLRAGVHVCKLQQPQRLVLRGAFVICQMSGSQHKPALLPRLYEIGTVRLATKTGKTGR